LGKGIVIKSTGSHYRVLHDDGKVTDCVIRGRFREKNLRTTNPVAVGDNVLFEYETKRSTGIITEILDRRNYILRKA
jgi:ribosome biogenesis GTPase / thiamine phosphate phosphatase